MHYDIITLIGIYELLLLSIEDIPRLYDSSTYYFHTLKCSDSLVFEAAGGESAAKAFRDNDEKAYREAEVIVLDLLGIAYCFAAFYML